MATAPVASGRVVRAPQQPVTALPARPPLPCGCSNSGFVQPGADGEVLRNTPQTFSHFTFEHTGGRLLCCDIQGVDDMYTVGGRRMSPMTCTRWAARHVISRDDRDHGCHGHQQSQAGAGHYLGMPGAVTGLRTTPLSSPGRGLAGLCSQPPPPSPNTHRGHATGHGHGTGCAGHASELEMKPPCVGLPGCRTPSSTPWMARTLGAATSG